MSIVSYIYIIYYIFNLTFTDTNASTTFFLTNSYVCELITDLFSCAQF